MRVGVGREPSGRRLRVRPAKRRDAYRRRMSDKRDGHIGEDPDLALPEEDTTEGAAPASDHDEEDDS